MKGSHWPPRHALITGASSGIGRALAEALAGDGTRLTLLGRDRSRLSGVVDACAKAGGTVRAQYVDVRDRAALNHVVLDADDGEPVDLLIANAGVSGGTAKDGGRDLLAINLQGVVDTVEPLVPRMLARGFGHVAVMSSLAGFKAMPNAPLYCASKAAVRSYGEALDARLRHRGVAVSVICPGFVETPLTAANPFAMPLLTSADEAAIRILPGLRRRRARIAFPRRLYLLVRLLEVLPTGLVHAMLARTAARGGAKE
ncbi:MAG: SDR family NAD(P)-dependent oxidoreductase [Geminicoccaceae bacterium]|nr:SDR family NAD(P)-dependent oxidoreductase [Geminicoccaceae bacterium]